MKSVRSYLIWRLLGGTTLILLVAVGAVYRLVSETQELQFDNTLTHRVQAFASILFQHEYELSFEFSGQLMPEYLPGPEASYFQLWLADGFLVERSESLEELDNADLEVQGAILTKPSFWTAPMPDGRMGRFVSQEISVHHVYPEEGPERPMPASVHVVVARGREALLAAELQLLGYCALFGCGVLLCIALMTRWYVGKGLSPALHLASLLDKIQMDDLPEGLQAGELPEELQPMAEKADALIQRAIAALQRERRTTADIAHELRTPISELLTVSEVALRQPEDTEEHSEALHVVREVSHRMARAISSLLKLAHLESASDAYEFCDLNLTELVRSELHARLHVRQKRELEVLNHLPRQAPIHGDQDTLRIIISNLVDNALHYSLQGSSILLEYERDGLDWELRLRNAAGPLAPEDLENLSQPFWRKERARDDPNRFGLGLALSLALAQRNKLSLTFSYEDGHFLASLRGNLVSEPSLPKLRILG